MIFFQRSLHQVAHHSATCRTYSPQKNVSEQGISLALCLAESYLSDKDAAWRVHGGGFAGTIQAFVKLEDAEGFKEYMDSAFGEGKCMILRVRTEGALKLA